MCSPALLELANLGPALKMKKTFKTASPQSQLRVKDENVKSQVESGQKSQSKKRPNPKSRAKLTVPRKAKSKVTKKVKAKSKVKSKWQGKSRPSQKPIQ